MRCRRNDGSRFFHDIGSCRRQSHANPRRAGLVYLAGGVISGLGSTLDRAAFRDRFEAKGRFRTYLGEIPCYVMTTAHPAFIVLAQFLNR